MPTEDGIWHTYGIRRTTISYTVYTYKSNETQRVNSYQDSPVLCNTRFHTLLIHYPYTIHTPSIHQAYTKHTLTIVSRSDMGYTSYQKRVVDSDNVIESNEK
jgi:hypothetical protein